MPRIDGISTGRATWRQYCQPLAPRFSEASFHSFFKSFERGGDGEDHQRELEEHVDDRQSPEVVEREVAVVEVEAEEVEEGGDDPDPAKREDEGGGQGDSGEVGGDPREGRQQRAEDPGQTAIDHRPGEQKAENPADDGGDQADPDGEPVRLDDLVDQRDPGSWPA